MAYYSHLCATTDNISAFTCGMGKLFAKAGVISVIGMVKAY